MYSQKKYLICTVILGSLFLVACSLSEKNKSISNQGITIEYPQDWTSLKLPGFPILVKEKAPSNTAKVLCNFAVEIDSATTNIDDYIKQLNQKFSTSKYIDEWNVIHEKKVRFKGYKGVEMISSCSAKGYKSKIRQIIIKQESRILNLSTTSSLESYDENKKITDKIFDSVTFE